MTPERILYAILYGIAVVAYVIAVGLLIYERVRIIRELRAERQHTGLALDNNFGGIAVDGWLTGMTLCLLIVGYLLARLLGWHGQIATDFAYPILFVVIFLPVFSAARVVHWERHDRRSISNLGAAATEESS